MLSTEWPKNKAELISMLLAERKDAEAVGFSKGYKEGTEVAKKGILSYTILEELSRIADANARLTDAIAHIITSEERIRRQE